MNGSFVFWLCSSLAPLLVESASPPPVSIGPSFIPNALAQGEYDITIHNNVIAFAISLSTNAWGLSSGTLCDLSHIKDDGTWHKTVTTFADFFPDQWIPWHSPNVGIQVASSGNGYKVQIERTYASALLVTTEYVLRAKASHLEVTATLYNPLPVALHNVMPGWTILAKSNTALGIPGAETLISGGADGRVQAYRSVQYGSDWVTALHTDFEYFSRSGQDLYHIVSLGSEETRSFSAHIQLVGLKDFDEVISHNMTELATISGRVTGVKLNYSAGVVIESVLPNGYQLLGWVPTDDQGWYEATVPVGSYAFYGDAEAHVPSERQLIELETGDEKAVDFELRGKPGHVRFLIKDIRKARLPGLLRITKQPGEIEKFHPSFYYSRVDNHGLVEALLAPGKYTAEVDCGFGYYKSTIEFEVVESDLNMATIYMRPVLSLSEDWKFADLRRRTPVSEEDFNFMMSLRAQMAAGLDVIVTTDYTTDHLPEVQEWCNAFKFVCLLGCELVASWGSFIPVDIQPQSNITADVYSLDFEKLMQLFRKDWQASALMISRAYTLVNTLSRLEAHDQAYDDNDKLSVLVSLNFVSSDWKESLETARSVWSEHTHSDSIQLLIVGGTNVDFTTSLEVHAADETTLTAVSLLPTDSFTTDNFIKALLLGRSYVTAGPLLHPSRFNFGDVIADGTMLEMTVASQYGVQAVHLLGELLDSEIPCKVVSDDQVTIEVTVSQVFGTWIAFKVVDKKGKMAISNPIWIARAAISGATSEVSLVTAFLVLLLFD